MGCFSICLCLTCDRYIVANSIRIGKICDFAFLYIWIREMSRVCFSRRLDWIRDMSRGSFAHPPVWDQSWNWFPLVGGILTWNQFRWALGGVARKLRLGLNVVNEPGLLTRTSRWSAWGRTRACHNHRSCTFGEVGSICFRASSIVSRTCGRRSRRTWRRHRWNPWPSRTPAGSRRTQGPCSASLKR